MEPNQRDRWAIWAAKSLTIAPGWRLRPLTDADIPAVYNGVDDHVRRGLRLERAFGQAEVAKLVRETAQALSSSGRGAVWGVAQDDAKPQNASKVQGVITLHAEDGNRAKVGFWLAAPARGRGIAADAVRALAQETIGANGLAGFTWESPVGNVDSLRVAQAANFRPVGTFSSAASADRAVHRAWWAELTEGAGVTDRLWADCLVEIAAGAWQLQPIDATSAIAAERLLPVSACVPTGVWAAREITTARVDAVVALIHRDDHAWVLARPAASSEYAATASAAASEVIGRYARQALGLITP